MGYAKAGIDQFRIKPEYEHESPESLIGGDLVCAKILRFSFESARTPSNVICFQETLSGVMFSDRNLLLPNELKILFPNELKFILNAAIPAVVKLNAALN